MPSKRAKKRPHRLIEDDNLQGDHLNPAHLNAPQRAADAATNNKHTVVPADDIADGNNIQTHFVNKEQEQRGSNSASQNTQQTDSTCHGQGAEVPVPAEASATQSTQAQLLESIKLLTEQRAQTNAHIKNLAQTLTSFVNINNLNANSGCQYCPGGDWGT